MNGLFALIEREKPFSIAAYFSEEKKEKYVAKRGYIAMIFEGKLLNRKQLLEIISKQNHTENNCLDADIALELFVQRGIDAFTLLEGYWALIVVDNDKQKIYAARDDFGNIPLYYCKTDKYFGIASKSRDFFSILKEAKEINKNAVFDFLLWGSTAKHQQNFFSNIHEIKPSCYLSYSLIDNVFEENSYYILPYKNCKAGYNEYEEPFHIDKVRQLVLETVRRNIEGKNKIAIGFDNEINSSTLLCCAKKLNPDLQIVAFISTDLCDGEESFEIEKVIKYPNIDWVKISCDSQLILKQLAKMNRVQDIPISNLSTVFQYNTMAMAKQYGFDAVMNGQGSDELFAGHSSYFSPFLQSLRSQWLFKDWLKELFHLRNSNISFKEIALQKLKNLSKIYYYNEEKLAKKIKSQELSFLNETYKNDYFSGLKHEQKQEDKTVLNDYLYESYTKYLPCISRLGVHSAANFGLDCIMPFSNSKALAEYVFSVPSTFKIHNGWDKYLLRSAMVGIVPDELRWQKRKSSSYSLEIKYLGEIKKQIYQLEDADNFIDKTAFLNAWDNLYKLDNIHFQQFVFRYYSYLLWREGM